MNRTPTDQLRAALLDLIETGPSDVDDDTVLRLPTKVEKATTRPEPSVSGPSGRSTEVPDPTHEAIVRTERTIAHQLQRLDQLVAAFADAVATTDALTPTIRDTGCVPRDEYGDPMPAPTPLPNTFTLPRAVATVVDWCQWIDAACDALDAVQVSEHADTTLLDSRIAAVHARLRHETSRATAAASRPLPRVTRCANPHGLHNHPLGPDPIGHVCRKCAARATRGRCPDPYARGCLLPLSEDDASRNASACGACRVWKHRKEVAGISVEVPR